MVSFSKLPASTQTVLRGALKNANLTPKPRRGELNAAIRIAASQTGNPEKLSKSEARVVPSIIQYQRLVGDDGFSVD